MSFDTPNGTRGASQPGSFMQLVNKMVIGRIRKGAKTMGMNSLVLTTIGAKSGAERTTPVAWFKDGDGWLVVASANGAMKNPAWYWNIAAHPDKVQIEMDGQKIAVVADQLHGEPRAKAWEMITTTMPRFVGYMKKTDRELPVIRLSARPS